MSYDEELALRVQRSLKSLRPVLREARSGMCFMLDRHLLCAVTDGGLITRVDPKMKKECLELEGVEDFRYRNRSSECWIQVASVNLEREDELRKWLAVSYEYGKFVRSGEDVKNIRSHRTII